MALYNKCNSIFFSYGYMFVFVFLMGIFSMKSSAAPSFGDTMIVKQPDGTDVAVRVWGDEFYRRVESLDGYTVVKDSKGWICYAILSNDKTQLIPTAQVYSSATALKDMSNYGINKHLEIQQERIQAVVKQRKQELFGDEEELYYSFSAERQPVGQIKGITILIDFPDDTATIAKTAIEDFMNKVGYTANGNNGSIYDYFNEVSSKKLEYTNIVSAYYRAKQSKKYYDDSASGKPKELLTEALNGLKDQIDFSQATTNSSKKILAVNVLYAGRCNSPWAKGLWPHSGGLTPAFTDDGVTVSKYQMTALGSGLTIGTTIHENGHMVCGFADLYDYSKDSKGVGGFCVMCGSGGKNPIIPNAYFRAKAGWETPTDITEAAINSEFKHVANSYSSFIYKNKSNTNEFFYLESRRKLGRNTQIPDTGLIIWHVDSKGSNNNQEMTKEKHYLVSLEQADGLSEMEKNVNSGKDGDLFHAGYKTTFNENTTPNSKWWDGSSSGFSIKDISAVGPEMSFKKSDQITAVSGMNSTSNPLFSLSSAVVKPHQSVQFFYTAGSIMQGTFAIYALSGKCMYTQTFSTVSASWLPVVLSWNVHSSRGASAGNGKYIALFKAYMPATQQTLFEKREFELVQ